jgi:hypothetical protein
MPAFKAQPQLYLSQAVAIAREELVYRLEDLTRFEYVTPEGRDQGVNVRHRHGLHLDGSAAHVAF